MPVYHIVLGYINIKPYYAQSARTMWKQTSSSP